MAPNGSVTRLFVPLRAGDPAAVQRLWERYYPRMVGLGRKKLQGLPQRAVDEKDVAQDAFISFWKGVEDGRFPTLDDRDDLWCVLVTLTVPKAARLRRAAACVKRGGGRKPAEESQADSGEEPLLEQVLAPDPTPEEAAEMAEELQRLLAALPEDLRKVAALKMEGHSNAEIAAQLGVVKRTVTRCLQHIRAVWRDLGGDG
jgi:RNA polymerase sigma factor (sigma-70 family)